MDELEYIENLETDELIKIIKNIWGFEETSKAICELTERDEGKTLELGMEIIEHNKGDDYLQGFVFGLIFDIDPKETLNSLNKRKKTMGVILLRDVMEEVLFNYNEQHKDLFTKIFLQKLIETYHQLDSYEQEKVKSYYNEFKSKIVV